MTTAPPVSQLTPTGVWLDHILGSEVSAEVFGEFASRSGRGIILHDGALSPDQSVNAVKFFRNLGLQAIVEVGIAERSVDKFS